MPYHRRGTWILQLPDYWYALPQKRDLDPATTWLLICLTTEEGLGSCNYLTIDMPCHRKGTWILHLPDYWYALPQKRDLDPPTTWLLICLATEEGLGSSNYLTIDMPYHRGGTWILQLPDYWYALPQRRDLDPATTWLLICLATEEGLGSSNYLTIDMPYHRRGTWILQLSGRT